jgi:hypothetical protein
MSYSARLRARLSIVAVVGLTAADTGFVLSGQASAVAGCAMNYTITSQWSGGFGANVSITNLGDPSTARP